MSGTSGFKVMLQPFRSAVLIASAAGGLLGCRGAVVVGRQLLAGGPFRGGAWESNVDT